MYERGLRRREARLRLRDLRALARGLRDLRCRERSIACAPYAPQKNMSPSTRGHTSTPVDAAAEAASYRDRCTAYQQTVQDAARDTPSTADAEQAMEARYRRVCA